MSSAMNHKKRSRRGHIKQHHTLAPKKSPMIDLTTPRRKKRIKPISSLFLKRTATG